MFTHVTVGANDIEASRRFYDAVFGVLGMEPGAADPKGRYWWSNARGSFAVGSPIDGEAACYANGGTIGFAAASPEAVAAFAQAGVEAGGTAIEDAPGPRETPFGVLHLAYLRDPSGNKICAVHRPG
jgi:catechol 2,3-dioxygenase-like lactoylglutathione lyase family enzyme